MKTLYSVNAFYPSFPIGCEPQAVPCEIRLVEANGATYLKTPFAMLNGYDTGCVHRQIDNRTYFATEANCVEYLNSQYPNWKAASPIMDTIDSAKRYSSLGHHDVADKCGVDIDDISHLARGSRRFTLKQVKSAVKALAK